MPDSFLHRFLYGFLRGFSQIMLQSNVVTGLLFLAGIAFNSLEMLLSAVCGCVAGQLVAVLGRFNREHLAQGLYGFNGALVGLCVSFFWPLSVDLLLILVAAAGLSSILMRLFIDVIGIPPYTAPFIFSGWLVLLLSEPTSSFTVVAMNTISLGAVTDSLMKGFGQVLFQDNSISGLLFLIGLIVSSRSTAIWAVLAVIISMSAAYLINYSDAQIQSGIYSYNAVLVAIALSVRGGIHPVVICIGIAATVLLTQLFSFIGVSALTAPFVIAAWLVLLIKYLVTIRINRSLIK